jgi:hypothetical protein
MSQDGVMGKFEALMRKHRGGVEAAATQPFQTDRQAPAPDAWLPVLTDVVQRGSPPPSAEDEPPTATAIPGHESVAAEEDLAPPMAEPALESPVSVEPPAEPVTVSEPPLPQEALPDSASETQDAQIAASLVDELAPKITGLMQEQVAEELRKSLNQSMTNLMANLNANLEEIVRQAVAEKLAGKDNKPS